jgi:hypothetical protein
MQQRNPPLAIVANCDICNPVPNCCDSCCEEGVECNNAVHVPDLDPIWQTNYRRQVFAFGVEDVFPQEMYEEQQQQPGDNAGR